MDNPTTLILALCPLLLASCGTQFGAAIYQTGTTTPALVSSPAKEAGKEDCDTYELYRIGDAYYVKNTYEYQPERYTHYVWNDYVHVEHFNYGPRRLSTPAPERVTLYRPYQAEDAAQCQKLGIPVPAAGGKLTCLTETEAARQGAVRVKTFESPQWYNTRDTLLPRSISDDLPNRKTALHYVALPAAAAAFVVLDIPCTIIGTITYPVLRGLGFDPYF